MSHDYKKMAGTLLIVASVQFLLLLVVAEALYPDYSVSKNYISDLGVGSTALLFNSSVFLLGLITVVGAYVAQRAFGFRVFTVLLLLTGIGAMGVGLFPEDVPVFHGVFSLIAFLFGGISVVVSYKLQNSPLSFFSVILGAMGLAALALFVSGTYLGLGPGGMERMIAHPVLLWAVSFGGYLLSTK